jgi:hypothetical protein
MTTRKTVVSVCTVLALAAAGTAKASDAVKAAVSIPDGQPVPILQQNGTGLTPGTYAIGTIQLFYTVQAFEFPTGSFATFVLGMVVEGGKPSPATDYSVPLTLRQTGSSNLTLTPDLSQFSVGDANWWDHTLVTISIPAGAPSDDGTDLVANLQMEAPGQNHLDTVTTIQVHIKLVHPTACLKLYNFITDEALTEIVTSTEVNVNSRRGTVSSINPYGQLSDNILVVNTCPVREMFDVMVALDPWFVTNPSGNPGNAVFTFSTSGELDPDTFNIGAFGTGSGQGQSLALTDITIAPGDMFLMTVHMSIRKGDTWTGGGSGLFSGFAAGLYATGGAFTTPLAEVGESNPTTASLDYTVR